MEKIIKKLHFVQLITIRITIYISKRLQNDINTIFHVVCSNPYIYSILKN